MNIFLADDHVMFRQGIKLLLENEKNITITGEASNGREAVREIVKKKPDVVIMDIFMPEMNGIDATEAILEDYPAIKVVILTMNSSREHIFRAFKAGASAYLLKELAGEELIRAVNAVHTGKRYICDSVSGAVIDDYIKFRDRTDEDDGLLKLTRREREITQLIAEGKSNRDVASILFLAPSTVATYRHRIMNKLELNDFSELIKFSIKNGLIPPD
ncbi:MAG: response regulator [Syntrophorhabdaceae bacterium]